MADQILSRAEVKALLSAMETGAVKIDDASRLKSKGEVRPCDLTCQSLLLRDQLDALDEVHDKFVSLLNAALSGALQKVVAVKLISKEIVKFGEFMQTFSNPTGFCIYTMEPLIGTALLAVEPGLGFALIDCMCGGTGRPLPKIREFTQIEQHMLRRFYADVLHALEQAWRAAYTIKVVQKKTETKPEFVNLGSPGDLALVFVFSVGGEEFSGNIHVCTPFLMLEPIKDKLSSRYLREKDRAHAFKSELTALLKDTRLNIVAELGKTVCTIGRILELEKDDVIKLNVGPQDPVIVRLEGVAKYLGAPGVVKGNRAVQIKARIEKDEGV